MSYIKVTSLKKKKKKSATPFIIQINFLHNEQEAT